MTVGGLTRAAAPRILIVRLSALGDVAMASGMLNALRARYPDAHLAWLVEPAAAPLLRGHPALDELLVWPRDQWRVLWRERRWRALWREVRALRQRLRAARFDIAIDAQGLLKSGVWCRLSAAPRRISVLGREGSGWLATERFDPRRPEPPTLGWEYRAVVQHLGADAASFRPQIAVTDAARSSARAALDAAGVGARYAVIAPFTTRPQKHWFDDEWVALAGSLIAHGLHPVMLGGPGDALAADRIAARAPALANLVGKLKLDASAAVIDQAQLLVGVDTGLTHIGSACAVPTVALFGSTRPYLDAQTPATRVLYHALPCSPCGRHPTCGGRFDCMRWHHAAAVQTAADELLAAVR